MWCSYRLLLFYMFSVRAKLNACCFNSNQVQIYNYYYYVDILLYFLHVPLRELFEFIQSTSSKYFIDNIGISDVILLYFHSFFTILHNAKTNKSYFLDKNRKFKQNFFLLYHSNIKLVIILLII